MQHVWDNLQAAVHSFVLVNILSFRKVAFSSLSMASPSVNTFSYGSIELRAESR